MILAKYRPQYQVKIEAGVKLTDVFAELLEGDTELFNALTWSTNSKWNIDYTLRKLKQELFDKNLL